MSCKCSQGMIVQARSTSVPRFPWSLIFLQECQACLHVWGQCEFFLLMDWTSVYMH